MPQPSDQNIRQHLLKAFAAATKAAQPNQAIKKAVQALSLERNQATVVGAGKAAASMAKALEDIWDANLSGVVVTPYGHALEQPQGMTLLEASHPLPDANSQQAGKTILETAQALTNKDVLIVLLSGGASALMVATNGLSLKEKILLNQQLLNSGANINEINTVRKHLSKIKGGRLAASSPAARIVSFIVSDVVGDDLSTIASGPTVPDPTTLEDAIHVLNKYDIHAPTAFEHLKNNNNETPKANHPSFTKTENHLIVTNATALNAARTELEQLGYRTSIYSDAIVGEAKDAAKNHAQKAKALAPGTVFLSGGETTVTVKGSGLGGRNTEFLLALAIELNAAPGIYAIACDTDGIDGPTEAAGAIITPDTLLRAGKLGLNAKAMLENNDAYSFFKALNDLVVVGPTGTNVNDFRCVLRENI